MATDLTQPDLLKLIQSITDILHRVVVFPALAYRVDTSTLACICF
jgi:hypothetical protein